MRNVLDESCRKNQSTHFMFSYFFRKSTVYNVEKYSGERGATNDVTIWRIRVACWISKAIYTYAHAHAHAPGHPHARNARTHEHAHTDLYVILIAFPQKRWFRESALYLDCPSCSHCSAFCRVFVAQNSFEHAIHSDVLCSISLNIFDGTLFNISQYI